MCYLIYSIILCSSIAELQAQRKRQKTSQDNLDFGESRLEPSTADTDDLHGELSEIFESDLSTAKAKFTEGENHVSCLQDSPNVKFKPSFGHRAGFDAFMTGYSFACIAISLRKLTSEPKSGWLSGVEEMKNKLANRAKAIPLHVTKSHFTNTSQQHRIAQSKISSFLKNSSDKWKFILRIVTVLLSLCQTFMQVWREVYMNGKLRKFFSMRGERGRGWDEKKEGEEKIWNKFGYW